MDTLATPRPSRAIATAGVVASRGRMRDRARAVIMPDAGIHPASASTHITILLVLGLGAIVGGTVASRDLYAQADSLMRAARPDTLIELAVPTTGSLYVRYGRSPARTVRPGAVATQRSAASPIDRETLRTMVREVIAEERAHLNNAARGAPASGPDLPSPDVQGIAADIERRILSQVERALAERRTMDSLFVRSLVAREMGRLDVVDRRPIIDAPREPRVAAGTIAPSANELAAAVADSLRNLERRRALRAEQRQREDDPRLTAEIARLRARADSLERARRAEIAARETTEVAAAVAERARYEALRRLDRIIGDVTAIRDTERGLTIVLGQGLFAVGQSTLSARALDEMRSIVAVLGLYPEHRLIAEGHTDATGDEEFNERLSRARAEAVRDALAARGIDPRRIGIAGYGERLPVADNATAAGRAINRRVEVVIEGARPPSESMRR